MSIYDLEKLKDEYLSRKDLYEKIGKQMCQRLESSIKNLGIAYSIKLRVKDVNSFVKKSIKKKCEDPFVEITDQIGIRIITTYQDEIKKIDKVIIQEFNNRKREDKLQSLEPNQLGYLGIHFEVPVYESLQELGELENDLYNGVMCEIQLHTHAQNLWANVSHQLSYKTANEPSVTVKRSIYRLISLIEIFDSEVNSAKAAILNQSDFPETNLLDDLEKYFREFSTKPFDREFSLQNLNFLKSLLKVEEIKGFGKLIEEFVDLHRERCKNIFDSYSQDERDSYKLLMLSQPESIFIFWRLEENKFNLLNEWEKFLPRELLEFMADVWGSRLPESY
jgi:ppGpp synthetase/RelA/SpoT-type nucleotidyltranferase